MGNFFASIYTASLVLMETQKIPMSMRELAAWSGKLSWHLKMICCTSEQQSNTWKAHLVGMGNDEK